MSVKLHPSPDRPSEGEDGRAMLVLQYAVAFIALAGALALSLAGR